VLFLLVPCLQCGAPERDLLCFLLRDTHRSREEDIEQRDADERVLFFDLFQRLGHVLSPNRLDLFDVNAQGGWRAADASGDEVLDAAKEANAEQV
jgi:hypothetical protein